MDIENPFANLSIQQNAQGHYVLHFALWNLKNAMIHPDSKTAETISPPFSTRRELPFWCSTNLKFRGRFVSTADWSSLLSDCPGWAEAVAPDHIKSVRAYYNTRHARCFSGSAYTVSEVRQILDHASERYHAIYIAKNGLMTVSDQLLFSAARQLRTQTA